MALVGHISGSAQTNSQIGITGSVVVANRPGALFPSLPADVSFYVSGSSDGTNKSVFGGGVVVSGSFSQGLTTIASGVYSHAEGRISVAHGAYSHAEGYFAAARGTYSHAEGSTTIALGQSSHAEGESNTASGGGAHAEGGATIASDSYAHAEGYGTIASAYGSHAEGGYTKSQGAYSHAEGYFAVALGSPSHAEGGYTIASGNYQHAGGKFNLRNNDHSLLVIGNGTGTADAARSDIIRVEINSFQVTGSLTQRNSGSSAVGFMGNEAGTPSLKGSDVFFYASGSIGSKGGAAQGIALFGGDLAVSGTLYATSGISGSITRLENGTSYLAAGSNITIVSASNGQITISSAGGSGSPAGTGNEIQYNDGGSFGGSTDYKFNNKVTDTVILSGSFAQGSGSLASGSYSHAEGLSTIASGTYSHAEGRLSEARGEASHAEGRSTIASNSNAHAEGFGTTASGNASHVEGYGTIASNSNSHAEGEFTLASGFASHAEGSTTTATANYSHAEGEFTTAKGYGSHAEGNETTTIGTFSHAEGFRTIASGSYQHVQGKYNTRNNNFSLFVVGNGNGTADASRSDVFRINEGVLGNGRVEVTGSFVSTVGLSGSLTNLSDGTSYLVAGSNITISSASNGAITISSTGGGGGATDDFFDSTTAGSIFTTGSAAFRGAESIDSPADKGSDVFFYVSGSTNGTDKSLFGGEIFVSGNIVTAGDIQVAGNDIKSSTGATAITLNGTSVIIPGDLTVNGTTVTVNTTNLEVKDAVVGLGFSSGTIAQTAGDRGLIVGLAGVDNAVFLWKNTESEFAFGRTSSSATGSLPISVSSYSNIHAGNVQAAIVTASLGFSGSLTKLVDGTSYLVAGSNVTISSASNGAITISSTGGGGAAADDFFDSTTAGSIFTTGSAAFRGTESIDSPSDKGTEVFFYVSGSTSATRSSMALFGGYVWISGSLVQGNFGASGGATGQYARAHGERTTASGASSHSEGRFALAQGTNSHAEGDSTATYGVGSHAEGLDSAAYGSYSHAEGRSTEARGLYSHAEGFDAIPRADYSHAEGRDTQVLAAGLYAHAEGSGSIAIGEASHAEGLGTLASGSYQLAVGKYNTRDNTSSLFVVGNGTSDSAANRSDIFRVESSSVQVTGSFVSTLGLSGSLTKLSNGASYLVAGSNVTITSASNGSVTISSTGGGGGGSNYLNFLAGTVTSTAASGSMESIGMDYLSPGLVGATTYTFEAILATTAGTTAYIDLYDYSGVINGTPGPISGSVLTGSSQSYTYLSANVTSQFSLAGGPGIIEARVWCTPNGSGLSAICKNAKLKVE